MRTCLKEFTMHVEPSAGPCGASTDWSAPMLCRLRIKDFNPADWIGKSCAGCTPSADPVWDGRFPTWLVGLGYNAQPGYSLDGRNVAMTSNVSFQAGFWRCAIICTGAPGGYVFLGINPNPASPLGTYLDNGLGTNCSGLPLSLVIEGFSL